MRVIIKPTARYLCGNCTCELYYIYGTNKEMSSGTVIGKCVNPECENKGKIVKIHPQVVEVEPEIESCVQQEVGKV